VVEDGSADSADWLKTVLTDVNLVDESERGTATAGAPVSSSHNPEDVDAYLLSEQEPLLMEAWSDSRLVTEESKWDGLEYVRAQLEGVQNELVRLADHSEIVDNYDEPGSLAQDDSLQEDYIYSSEALGFVYGQYCTAGKLGFAHTHQTSLDAQWVGNRGAGACIELFTSSKQKTSVAGGQVYVSKLPAITKQHSRKKFYSQFGYFCVHIENLLQECPDPKLKLIPEEASEREVIRILTEMDFIHDLVKSGYKRSDSAGSTRFEIFHVVTDLEDIQHSPVPQYPYHKIMNAYYTRQLNDVMVSKFNDGMGPLLQTFLKARSDNAPKDYPGISLEGKVALMYQVELLTQVIGIGGCSTPILKSIAPVLDQPVFHELPKEQLVELSLEERTQTGLSYGVNLGLLTTPRFVSRLTNVGASRGQLAKASRFNLSSICMNQVVREVRMYLDSVGALISLLRSATINPLGPPPDDSTEIDDDSCVFLQPDYVGLRSLDEAPRWELLKKICVILVKMYRHEWGWNISKKIQRVHKKNGVVDSNGNLIYLAGKDVPLDTRSVENLEDTFGEILKVAYLKETGVPTDDRGIVRTIGKCLYVYVCFLFYQLFLVVHFNLICFHC
jgi:hypothetical protein